MAPKRLLLFDVAAAAFRSHFAMKNNPLRRRSDQRPTSALNGYCNYLLAMLKLVKPTHVVAALESSTPTFRHRTYPLYKAQRTPPPPELVWQLQHIGDLSRALGVAPVRFDGFEADDVIGSLAHRAQADGFDHVHIFSHDKDFMQLLNERVTLHRPVSGGAVELVTPEDVSRAHAGVTPAQFVDYLSLTGDAVDNIPGVSGVGPVSASQLLVAHGDVRGILRACIHAEPAFAGADLPAGAVASTAKRRSSRPKKKADAATENTADAPLATAAATAAAADTAASPAATPTASATAALGAIGVSAELRGAFERDWSAIVADATATAAAAAASAAASSAAPFKFRTRTTARAILAHRYQLLLNQTLAAIRTDVAPLPAWDELTWKGVPPTATPALHEYDLYSAANRFRVLSADSDAATAATASSGDATPASGDVLVDGIRVKSGKVGASKSGSHMQLLSDVRL